MKELKQIKPNYGPVYASAIYPGLSSIFQKHGYALSVHGSVARDFDLIAVPWATSVSDVDSVFDEIESMFAVTINREDYAHRNHGRRAWIIAFGFGECAVDLSFIGINWDNTTQDK